MAQLKLISGGTTVTLEVDNIFERVMENQLNASKSYNLAEGEDIPTIPDVPSTFDSLEITSGEEEIKVVKDYNTVKDFSTSYFEKDKIFSVSIMLGYQAEE